MSKVTSKNFGEMVVKSLEEAKTISTESAHKSPTGSLRLNSGKPEFSQLDPEFILELANLMTKSSAKYGKHNWALGQEFHTPIDSLQRHLLSFLRGEDVDPESGVSHVLHMAANVMILYRSTKIQNSLPELQLDTRFHGFKKD